MHATQLWPKFVLAFRAPVAAYPHDCLPMVVARVILAIVAALAVGAAGEADPPPFNKEELEVMLRAQHSQKISNVYDPHTKTQYTWNVEKQELCPGVSARRPHPSQNLTIRGTPNIAERFSRRALASQIDGRCDKEEL